MVRIANFKIAIFYCNKRVICVIITIYNFSGVVMAKKKKSWMKTRHRVVRVIAGWLIGLYSKIKYNIKIEKFKEQGNRPYLILFNHQTACDQFFVGLAFKGPVYYVASEDLFSNGFTSALIKWLVAPIPIKKQSTDLSAVMTCIRVAKEGGTIAMAPEGNRTYSGRTCYMNPAVAGLAKKIGLPIALYRIEGGYGAHPRWSDVVRRGKMRSYVAEVIEPEEYKSMSNEELLARVEKGLFVDENVADIEFLHDKRAEYIERALYVCPFCGLSSFHSEKSVIKCEKCGRKIIYGNDKTLRGVDHAFPFKFVGEWYQHQENFVNALDPSLMCDEAAYTEKCALYEVIPYKKKIRLKEDAVISLFGDKIVIGEGADALVLPFAEISAVAVLGKNKLNVYFEKHIFQIKSDKRFNALKYVNFYFRYKNVEKGEENGCEFLGI